MDSRDVESSLMELHDRLEKEADKIRSTPLTIGMTEEYMSYLRDQVSSICRQQQILRDARFVVSQCNPPQLWVVPSPPDDDEWGILKKGI